MCAHTHILFNFYHCFFSKYSQSLSCQFCTNNSSSINNNTIVCVLSCTPVVPVGARQQPQTIQHMYQQYDHVLLIMWGMLIFPLLIQPASYVCLFVCVVFVFVLVFSTSSDGTLQHRWILWWRARTECIRQTVLFTRNTYYSTEITGKWNNMKTMESRENKTLPFVTQLYKHQLSPHTRA